jgi:hypothetical protein
MIARATQPDFIRATALWVASLPDEEREEAFSQFLLRIRDKAIARRNMGFSESVRLASRFGHQVVAELEKAAQC